MQTVFISTVQWPVFEENESQTLKNKNMETHTIKNVEQTTER